MLLFFVEMMVGLCLSNMLYIEIENPDRLLSERTDLFTYFGTFSRTMITMTELTMGNFVPVCRFLTEKVDEGYGHGILIYKVTVGFGMLRVISGVFLHDTFKAAATDDELMVVQKLRTQQKHKKKMMYLYNAADSKGLGHISHRDFVGILKSQRMRTWLSAQDVNVGDGSLLFELIDDGDDKLTAAELVQGMARMKGPARSLDMIGLMHTTSHLSDMTSRLSSMMSDLSSQVLRMDAKMDAKLKPKLYEFSWELERFHI